MNVVVGPGRTCGQRLVEHPDVAKIAFTGSTEVGRSIAAGAAQTIKRVTLELGGKSPNIVFADADLEAAAAAAPGAVFGNAGQDCCARSRILVEARALDEFMAMLEKAVTAIRVGDPLDPATRDGAADLGRAARRPWPRSWPTTPRWRSAAARPTARVTGSRRRCCARSNPTPAPRARRSSGRWRR